jgi:hypothetical protein
MSNERLSALFDTDRYQRVVHHGDALGGKPGVFAGTTIPPGMTLVVSIDLETDAWAGGFVRTADLIAARETVQVGRRIWQRQEWRLSRGEKGTERLAVHNDLSVEAEQ